MTKMAMESLPFITDSFILNGETAGMNVNSQTVCGRGVFCASKDAYLLTGLTGIWNAIL